MAKMKHPPGTVRDAIVAHLDPIGGEASVSEITRAVEASIGDVPASSVRSYLRLRPDLFRRTRHGFYQLKRVHETDRTRLTKRHQGWPNRYLSTAGQYSIGTTASSGWNAARRTAFMR